MKTLRTTVEVEGIPANLRDPTGTSGRWYFDSSKLVFDNISTRIAFDSAPVAVVLCDLSGQLVHANRRFQDLMGIESLESVLRNNLAAVCMQRLKLGFLEQLAIDGEPRCYVLPLLGNDNHPLQVVCHARRIQGEELVPRWLVVTITELVIPGATASSPLAIDWSEAELHAGVGHWQISGCSNELVDNWLMTCSSGMCNFPDATPSMSITCVGDWLSLMSSNDRVRMRKALLQLASDGVGFEMQYELPITGTRGAKRIMHSRARRQSMSATPGRYLLVGTEQDITSHSDPQRQRERAVAALKSVFDFADFPVCALDDHYRVIYENDAGQSLRRWQSGAGDESAGWHASSRLRTNLVGNVRRVLQGERRIQAIEFKAEDGGSLWYDLIFNPIKSEDGRILGAVMVGTKLENTIPSAHHARRGST